MKISSVILIEECNLVVFLYSPQFQTNTAQFCFTRDPLNYPQQTEIVILIFEMGSCYKLQQTNLKWQYFTEPRLGILMQVANEWWFNKQGLGRQFSSSTTGRFTLYSDSMLKIQNHLPAKKISNGNNLASYFLSLHHYRLQDFAVFHRTYIVQGRTLNIGKAQH